MEWDILMYTEVWVVVDTINMCHNLSISFPTRSQQQVFAREFERNRPLDFIIVSDALTEFLFGRTNRVKCFLQVPNLDVTSLFVEGRITD